MGPKRESLIEMLLSLFVSEENWVWGKDGWMLLFSISNYRWLRCYVMLLKISVYIYNIYKLKIITLMQ